MFFSFGHKKSTSFGNVESKHCPICNTELGMKLERITSWNTFCFLPIFDYEQVFLTCPDCQHTMEIKNTQEYFKARFEIDSKRINEKSGLREELDFEVELKKYTIKAFIRKNVFKFIIALLIMLVIIYDIFFAGKNF